MKKAIAILLFLILPVVAHSQSIFRQVDKDVEIPLNRLFLSADGTAPDTAFAFNDAGISVEVECTPLDGDSAPTNGVITPTDPGAGGTDYDLENADDSDSPFYTLFLNDNDGGANWDNDTPADCFFGLEADSILIATSPEVRFDFLDSRGMSPWDRGTIGADSDTSGAGTRADPDIVDLGIDAEYADDYFNDHMFVFYDNSGEVKYKCHGFDFVGATSLLLVACNLPTEEDNVDQWIVTDEQFAAAPDNFRLLLVDANGRVDVGSVLGATQTAGDLAALINAIGTTAVQDGQAYTDQFALFSSVSGEPTAGFAPTCRITVDGVISDCDNAVVDDGEGFYRWTISIAETTGADKISVKLTQAGVMETIVLSYVVQ